MLLIRIDYIIKIGYINWSIDYYCINDIIDYLINKEYFSTIGGGERNYKDLNNLGNIHVKTNQSISLPIIDNNGMPKGIMMVKKIVILIFNLNTIDIYNNITYRNKIII